MSTFRDSQRLHGHAAMTAVVAVVLALAFAGSARAEDCPGTKEWYDGACRYPDDIAARKAEKAREAEKQRKAEAARRAAQKRKAEEAERRRREAEKKKPEPEPAPSVEPEADDEPEDPEPATPPPAKPEPPLPKPEPAAAPDRDPPPLPRRPTRSATSHVGPDEVDGGMSPAVWVGFGLAGTAALVGVITGAVSFSQASDLKDQCPNDACTPDKQEDIDAMLAIGHASTASFVIAGLGAAVGVVGLVASDWSSKRKEALIVVPILGPANLGVRGAF